MPRAVRRNLHSCFSVIKRPLLLIPPPTAVPEDHHSRPIPNLFKSYNSLYDDTTQPPTPPLSSAAEPDFAAVCASQRFFFSSPGRSNSIVDSSSADLVNIVAESSSSSSPAAGIAVKDGVAVPTYSPDPYRDFRRSMQEMVDATRGRGGLVDVGSSWEYLHELLLSYLALNPKSTHKFIVCAFADLLLNLLSDGACRQ